MKASGDLLKKVPAEYYRILEDCSWKISKTITYVLVLLANSLSWLSNSQGVLQNWVNEAFNWLANFVGRILTLLGCQSSNVGNELLHKYTSNMYFNITW